MIGIDARQLAQWRTNPAIGKKDSPKTTESIFRGRIWNMIRTLLPSKTVGERKKFGGWKRMRGTGNDTVILRYEDIVILGSGSEGKPGKIENAMGAIGAEECEHGKLQWITKGIVVRHTTGIDGMNEEGEIHRHMIDIGNSPSILDGILDRQYHRDV
jgi:hypothetical protein